MPKYADEIWEFSVDAAGAVYAEGESNKAGGWFCIEFDNEDDARDELTDLGFTDEQIDAVREA